MEKTLLLFMWMIRDSNVVNSSWREGPTGKSICHSCRGPEFKSLHPHEGLSGPQLQVQGAQWPVNDLCRHQTHM